MTKRLDDRYNVTRTDGRSAPGEKHEGCAYFVLDLTHDRYTVPAVRAYADAVRLEHPQLAADLDALIVDAVSRFDFANADAAPGGDLTDRPRHRTLIKDNAGRILGELTAEGQVLPLDAADESWSSWPGSAVRVPDPAADPPGDVSATPTPRQLLAVAAAMRAAEGTRPPPRA
jgi:hypothetical protein